MGTTLDPRSAPPNDAAKTGQAPNHPAPSNSASYTLAQGYLKRLAWRLRWHLGWAGTAGLALLLLSLLLALGLAWPRSLALQQLQRDVAAMHQAMPQHQGQWIDRSPQASLNTFYQFLPAEQQANALLSQLLQIAEQHGLLPEKVDYALQRETAAHFARYQLNLPLRGSYRDIRRFLAQALNSNPALALNELNLKRIEDGSNNGQDEVEAKLRLTLYLHTGISAAANPGVNAGAESDVKTDVKTDLQTNLPAGVKANQP